MKPLLIFLIFLQVAFLYAQPKDTTIHCGCNNGYILNVNGKNKCIDTTDFYYFPYYYKNMDDYSSWNYTILMKIFNEPKWNSRTITEAMRILFFDINFDTLYLFSFSNMDKDTICMIRYKSTYYQAPPPKPSCGKFAKKDYPSYSTMQAEILFIFFSILILLFI